MAIATVSNGDRWNTTKTNEVINQVNANEDAIENISTGHDHDGTDSKRIPGVMKLLHEGHGSMAAGEATVDTHTFSANDFGIDDTCYIEAWFEDVTSGAGLSGEIQIGAGTKVVDIAQWTGSGVDIFCQVWLHNGRTSTDELAAMGYYIIGGALTAVSFNDCTGIATASAITTAWTINLNGSADQGSGYFRWKVYRLPSD
jgi:hypothetical protein